MRNCYNLQDRTARDPHSKIERLGSSIMLKRFGYGLVSWFRRKLVDPLYLILRRGTEPKQLSFSFALGICLGLFPICVHDSFFVIWTSTIYLKLSSQGVALFLWVTVFLCGIAIAVLGSLCHAPTVMLANFIATPIELSLMIPFLRFGEFITGGPHFPLTSDALKKVLTGEASQDVLQSILRALLGWLVAAPIILGGLYILCLPCFKILVYKFSAASSSPKKQSSSPKMQQLSSITSPRLSFNSPPGEVRLKVRDA